MTENCTELAIAILDKSSVYSLIDRTISPLIVIGYESLFRVLKGECSDD